MPVCKVFGNRFRPLEVFHSKGVGVPINESDRFRPIAGRDAGMQLSQYKPIDYGW